jgi:hypothetical protein
LVKMMFGQHISCSTNIEGARSFHRMSVSFNTVSAKCLLVKRFLTERNGTTITNSISVFSFELRVE